MPTLLHIDSSARATRSHSRRLSNAFVEAWLARVLDTRVIRRDVGINPPPAINEQWIASAFTAEAERSADMKAALSVSDAYIDELVQSVVIVMGAPIYNYGMPAALKAWFDQVVRVDRTFNFDPTENVWPLSPMLTGKTLVILTSRGERKTTLCFFAHLMFEKDYLRPFSHSLASSYEFCSVLNNALRSKTHE